MNFFHKLASLLQGNKSLGQTKEDDGQSNIQQIEDMERNNNLILNSSPTFNSQRGALEENTEKGIEMAEVCSSIDTKEANSMINSNDDEYKNKSDPNDKMEITIDFDKIKFPKEDNELNNLDSIDDHINDQLDFETIIAVSKIKKDVNNIDEGIDQFSYDLNVLSEIPNTNDLETIKTDLITSIVENNNNKNIIDFDNFEDFSVNLNRHDLANNALHNFNDIDLNDTTYKKDFIFDLTDEIKEFENILDNYQQKLNTNETFITNAKDTNESHEVLEILQSMDHNMSYIYKDEIEIKKLSKSNATGDAISAVYSVSSNETDNEKKLSRELSNASIISISSTEVDLRNGIEATAQRNEIKKDPLIEDEDSDSGSDGYHSSDFEFITESDAEKDGLYINCSNKKQKHVNATKNSNVHTLEINADSNSNYFPGPSTSRENFYKTRHAPSATVTAETANNGFKAEHNHNNNVGPSTSKENFKKSHIQSATDARVTSDTANNHSKSYYNNLKMQFLMKESANRRERHSIPQGESYINLFREVVMPIWIDMENKYVTPPKCMALGQDDIGFGRGIHRLNSEERQFRKEADESVKKILEMYPEENRKRKRRF